MDWLFRQLNSTPKRILAATVASVAIILAVSTFAQSSYVQTQKVQIESSSGRHCTQWTYRPASGNTQVSCERFAQ